MVNRHIASHRAAQASFPSVCEFAELMVDRVLHIDVKAVVLCDMVAAKSCPSKVRET